MFTRAKKILDALDKTADKASISNINNGRKINNSMLE